LMMCSAQRVNGIQAGWVRRGGSIQQGPQGCGTDTRRGATEELPSRRQEI
jgi:hypothetical protein